MKKVIVLYIVLVFITVAGGDNSQKSGLQCAPTPTATVPKLMQAEMTLQSGETLSGFQLHFINHETDWKLTNDPVRIRISDTETQDIGRAKLRQLLVEQIERDERGAVKKLHVVYVTDEGEIRGWSFPSGVFAVQLYISPANSLSPSEIRRLFVKEIGFHVNPEVRDEAGNQYVRVPLSQIKSVSLPDGAIGDGLGQR